jgi:hypothetical protein
MTSSVSLTVALLVAAAAAAQPPAVPPPLPAPPAIPAPPPPKTVEQLVQELEAVQAQKAALLKREADLKAEVRKKLAELNQRVEKLDPAPDAAKAGEPSRVGRVLLDGFGAEDDAKVLKAVGVSPGQVIQYPALVEARDRLEKLGYRDVEVVPLPGEQDPVFNDILVKGRPGR